MLLNTGKTLRITNGYATRECARIIIREEFLRSKYGLLKAIRNPNPITTEDIPKGIMNIESDKLPLSFREAMKYASVVPIKSEIYIAALANRIEFHMTWGGGW